MRVMSTIVALAALAGAAWAQDEKEMQREFEREMKRLEERQHAEREALERKFKESARARSADRVALEKKVDELLRKAEELLAEARKLSQALGRGSFENEFKRAIELPKGVEKLEKELKRIGLPKGVEMFEFRGIEPGGTPKFRIQKRIFGSDGKGGVWKIEPEDLEKMPELKKFRRDIEPGDDEEEYFEFEMEPDEDGEFGIIIPKRADKPHDRQEY